MKSIAQRVDQVELPMPVIAVNEEIYDEARKIDDPEEMNQFIMKHDPRNTTDQFLQRFSKWANNETVDLTHLSLMSRIRTVVASLFYGTPASLGMPHYFFYTEIDKIRCSPFHFDTKTIDDYDVSRFHLFVNRFSHLFRKAAIRRVVFLFLVFGAGAAATQSAILKTESMYGSVSGYFHNLSAEKEAKKARAKNLADQAIALKAEHDVKKITDQEYFDRATALKKESERVDNPTKEDRINLLIEQAKQLNADHDAHKITDAEFEKRGNELSAQEQEINKSKE